MTIKLILNRKGRDVWSVAPTDSVYAAIERMAEKGVGALVVKEQDALVGIISERDYARKVILKGKASRETRVSEVMTASVITAPESTSIDDAMSLMTDRRIRHLPIIEDGAVTGMISMGDLVKFKLKDQENLIEHLENYITR
ncbi:MAG: histidine kinase [Bacteroidetes bacterium CG12_big_fil_rev_8_21_14_0_65_60_17]|nr:MAG: histidine kinase [Bacteroidetes bacterium CG12_big_fil_rev_8_21_14_0_65_60_17]